MANFLKLDADVFRYFSDTPEHRFLDGGMKMTKDYLECCQIKNKSDVGKERVYANRLLQ